MRERIIAILILFVIWAAATWPMIDFANKLEAMKIIVTSLGGYGVLSATLLNIWNAWEASKNFVEKIKFDKTENSFKFFERWDSNSLKEARDLTRSIKNEKENLSDNDLRQKIKATAGMERSVITMFNFWEEIYRSIEVKRVDAALLKQSFGEIYCSIYERFKVWRDDNRNSYPKAMKALDDLNDLWKNP